jgi:hypothetical protein
MPTLALQTAQKRKIRNLFYPLSTNQRLYKVSAGAYDGSAED